MRSPASCRKTASSPLCWLSLRTMRSRLAQRMCDLLQHCSLAPTQGPPKPRSQGLATEYTVLQKSNEYGVKVMLPCQPVGKHLHVDCARGQMYIANMAVFMYCRQRIKYN